MDKKEMKYLKIRITRGDPKKGEHQMVYPEIYDAQEVEVARIGPILYPNEIGKGANQEDCVICFGDDKAADVYIAESGGDIVELTEAQVDDYMQKRWERRNDSEERVMDSARIIAVQVKSQINQPLTDEDRAVLDPDNRIPGLNRMNKDHNIFFHRFKADNKK